MLIMRSPKNGQGWEYAAKDFKGMRWKMARELMRKDDKIWIARGALRVLTDTRRPGGARTGREKYDSYND